MSIVSELVNKGKGVAKNLLPFASLIPGPWGAAAAGVSGLMAGSEARGEEDAVMAIQRSIAEQNARLFQQYGQPAADALARSAGFTTGPDGKPVYNPDFNPNAAYADQFFNPANLSGDMVAYREAGDRNYDSAVQAAKADALNHGFIGRDSLTGSNIANIRTEQGRDNAGFQRSLLTDQVNRKNAFLMEGLNDKEAAGRDLLNLTSGSAQGAYGTLGGLQANYASRAGNAASGVGQLAGVSGQGILPGDQPMSPAQGGMGGIGDTISSAINWLKRQTGWGNKGFNYPTSYK